MSTSICTLYCRVSFFDMPQEYKDLKKLGDSLLNRSSKLTDMIAKLESEVTEKPEQSPERKRVDRS